MRISEEKIQEVLAKTDIVSLISRYTKLQKHGQDYLGLCLFHQDSNPSMNVSSTKKIFKCFSCGVGGNAIDFLMKYKNLTFIETIVELAAEFNVDLGKFSLLPKKEKYSENEKIIFDLNLEASKYYQVNLNANIGTIARNYLTTRKINSEQIQLWEIGYAVGNEIVKHLLAIGYSEKQIVDAGLATKKDNGIFDYFVDRIVFPIKNQDGYIIGFSGRVLTDEKPKYLNTRETLVFKKANILFNLNQVWKLKERLDSIILLEGFMDVISLEKVGIKNAMALMGTAFSNFHLQIFKELKKPIKLFLDGDNAGINAMYKISEILIKNNLKFSIIDNNTKHDPDELVNQGQKDQILKMIAEPINPYQYFLNKLFNEQKQLSFDQLTQISEKILSLLKYESNYLLVDKVENILSTKLGVSKLAIDKVIQQDKKNQSEVPKKIEKPNLNYSLDKYEIGRNRIFVSLLKSDEFLVKTEPIISQISGTIFYEKIFKSLINFYQTNQYQGNNLIKFFELLQKENFTNEEINLVKQMIRKPPNIFNKDLESRDKKDLELSDQEFNDIIKEFKIKEFDQEISSILKTIQDLDQQITMVNDQKQKEILKQKRANSISRSQKLSEHKRELNKEKE